MAFISFHQVKLYLLGGISHDHIVSDLIKGQITYFLSILLIITGILVLELLPKISSIFAVNKKVRSLSIIESYCHQIALFPIVASSR